MNFLMFFISSNVQVSNPFPSHEITANLSSFNFKMILVSVEYESFFLISLYFLYESGNNSNNEVSFGSGSDSKSNLIFDNFSFIYCSLNFNLNHNCVLIQLIYLMSFFIC